MTASPAPDLPPRRAQPSAARSDARSSIVDPLLVAVCLAVVTAPIEISGFLFPTTLVNLSRIAMLAAIAIVAWRIVVRRATPVLPPRSLLVASAAVIALELGSTLVTRWPNAGREIAALLFYAAFAFCVVQVAADRRRLAVVGACILAAAVAEAALVVLQGALGFYLTQVRDMAGRRNGTFIDPNITARFLLLGLVVTLGAARRPFRMALPVAAVSAAMTAVALVLTFSRTGWVLFVAVLVVAAAVSLRDRRALGVTAVAAATFALCLVAIPNALHRATDLPLPDAGAAVTQPAARSRVASTSATGPGATIDVAPADDAAPPTPVDGLLERLPLDPIRRYLARAAVAMFVDHPLVGVGVGGFQPMIRGAYADYVPSAYRDRDVTVAHTDVLRVAAEEGLLGLAVLAAFLAAVGVALARVARLRSALARDAAFVVGLGLIIIAVAAQTEGRFYNDPYLWLLVGVLGGLGYHPETDIVAR